MCLHGVLKSLLEKLKLCYVVVVSHSPWTTAIIMREESIAGPYSQDFQKGGYMHIVDVNNYL